MLGELSAVDLFGLVTERPELWRILLAEFFRTWDSVENLRRFVPVASPADIEATLLREGPGSRAIVAAERPAPEQGHVFNAVNVEGRVYFVDGQTGGAAVYDPSYIKFEMLQTFPRKP